MNSEILNYIMEMALPVVDKNVYKKVKERILTVVSKLLLLDPSEKLVKNIIESKGSKIFNKIIYNEPPFFNQPLWSTKLYNEDLPFDDFIFYFTFSNQPTERSITPSVISIEAFKGSLLFVLEVPNDLNRKELNTYVNSRYFSETIFHELTHFFDKEAYKDLDVYKGSEYKKKRYLSQDLEIRAYVQEMISSIPKNIKISDKTLMPLLNKYNPSLMQYIISPDVSWFTKKLFIDSIIQQLIKEGRYSGTESLGSRVRELIRPPVRTVQRTIRKIFKL